MYDEILVPTDGSAAAERALDHAVDIAETYGARIHAVYVVDAGSYSTLEAGSQVVMEALEEEGEQAVERVKTAAADRGVEVVTDVVAGSAHSSLLQYAEENDVDLIVMGTHGRRGLNRYLLGSVTERIVRSSDVPVLTVGPGREE